MSSLNLEKCPICGSDKIKRDIREETFEFKDNVKITINAPGWYCDECNEVFYDWNDMGEIEEAISRLKNDLNKYNKVKIASKHIEEMTKDKSVYHKMLIDFVVAKEDRLFQHLEKFGFKRGMYINKKDIEWLLNLTEEETQEIWNKIVYNINTTNSAGLSADVCPFCLYYMDDDSALDCEECEYDKNHGKCDNDSDIALIYQIVAKIDKVKEIIEFDYDSDPQDIVDDYLWKVILPNEWYKSIIGTIESYYKD